MWKLLQKASLWRQIWEAEIAMLLAVLVWGQALRISTSWADVPLIGVDIVMGVLVVSWLLGIVVMWRPLWRINLLWGVYFLVTAILFSWIANWQAYSYYALLVSTGYMLRVIAYWLLPVIVGNAFLKSQRVRLIQLMLASSAVFAVFGLLQYIFFPDFHSLQVLGWDPHLYRLAGTLFDPGYSGLWLVLALLLLVGIRQWTRKLWIHDGLLLLMGVALALTFSRASYLALMAGLLTLLVLGKRLQTIILLLLVVSLAVVLAPKPGGEGVNLARQSTVQLRIYNWQTAFEIIQDYPVFGVGFNRYRSVAQDYNGYTPDWNRSHSGAGVDNSLLFISATMGVFGFLLWVGWFVYLLIRLWKSMSGDTNGFASVAIASLIAWGVHSMFHNSLFYAPTLVWMGMILGLALKDDTKTVN